MSPRKVYPNFDVLRLFLAIEVVWLHYTAALGHMANIPINPVPAFLAVSGFLVLQSFENSPSWGRFAWKRACRVMPAFAACLGMIWLVFGYGQLAATLKTYATVGLPFGSVDGAVWSLAAEEIAYFILAALSLCGAYRAKWPIWIMLGIALALPSPEGPMLKVSWLPVPFLVGSLMYLYRDCLKTFEPWIWGALFMAVLIFGGRASGQHWSLLAQSFAVVGFGAFGPKLKMPKMPDFSYGIYLWHLPIIAALGIHWFTIPAVASVAIASWFIIEKPALRLKDYGLDRSNRVRRGLGVVPVLANLNELS